MPNLAMEREHLAKVDYDIAQGERRITAQMLLIERLRIGNCDTRVAERLLLEMQTTLEAWKGHRALILREIARLEPGDQDQDRSQD
jgi:hypothetical protein